MASRDVVLVIADISGYTRFLVGHGKAQAHSDTIIGALLEAIMAEVEPTLEVLELEGDAVFMYAALDRSGGAAEQLGQTLERLMQAFTAAVYELGSTMICRCPACANIADLRLKLIVHAGQAVLSERGRFTRLSGTDVIVAHRLLKNGVESDEYILLTEPAIEAVAFSREVGFEPIRETYDEIGAIDGQVATDLSSLTTWDGQLRSKALSTVGFEILRNEIQTEYREVASQPDKGFHFHTGRALAEKLGYPPEQIDGVPTCSLESFAGTGNPHALGPIPQGASVVDLGCGAGFDTMIAARRVGPTGLVVGIDMTDAMLDRAREGAKQSGFSHVEIKHGYVEALPLLDSSFDFLISNGVFNLCPDKPKALAEMLRVCKPGGHLYIGDIMVQRPVPEGARGNIDLWTG